MTKPVKLNFERLFFLSTISLRIIRAHPNIPRNKKWMVQFFLITFYVLISYFLLLYSLLVHDLKNKNYMEASKNIVILIVFISIYIKYYVFVKNQQLILDIIQQFEDDYHEVNHYSEEDKLTVERFALKGVNVSFFWLIATTGTLLVFPVKALIIMGHSYVIGDFQFHQLFPLTYPEPLQTHRHDPPIFWFLFVKSFSFGTYVAIAHVGFDPVVPIFLLHISGQTVLLSRRINRVFSNVEDKDYNEIFNELKSIIIKGQELYEYMANIKNNFSILYEYIMKSTTFLLPLISFQIIEDLGRGNINYECILFMTCAILHFFIPALYSDRLFDESENFRQAVYAAGWEKCPDRRVRQIVLFMLTRANLPMGLRTVFYEVNLDSFSEMVRQSYGILNLMNAAWR